MVMKSFPLKDPYAAVGNRPLEAWAQDALGSVKIDALMLVAIPAVILQTFWEHWPKKFGRIFKLIFIGVKLGRI